MMESMLDGFFFYCFYPPLVRKEIPALNLDNLRICNTNRFSIYYFPVIVCMCGCYEAWSNVECSINANDTAFRANTICLQIL